MTGLTEEVRLLPMVVMDLIEEIPLGQTAGLIESVPRRTRAGIAGDRRDRLGNAIRLHAAAVRRVLSYITTLHFVVRAETIAEKSRR